MLETKDKGIECLPTIEYVESYADADYSGNWSTSNACEDKATSRSRTGFENKYAGMPVSWVSKMQTEAALCSIESKYIALSNALQEAISMIDFLQELVDVGFSLT
jgi:hypothetical protein